LSQQANSGGSTGGTRDWHRGALKETDQAQLLDRPGDYESQPWDGTRCGDDKKEVFDRP
jgi:hypothetical protein